MKKSELKQAAYEAGMNDSLANEVLCENAEEWIRRNSPRSGEDTKQELLEIYSDGFYGKPLVSKDRINFRMMNMADVSTCHVTRADTYLLDEDRDDMPLVAYKYAEGYFIPLSDASHTKNMKEGMIKYGFSKEFASLVDTLMEQGWQFLRLDCDGMEYSDLTKFDW
jgi:hypothetical protein